MKVTVGGVATLLWWGYIRGGCRGEDGTTAWFYLVGAGLVLAQSSSHLNFLGKREIKIS